MGQMMDSAPRRNRAMRSKLWFIIGALMVLGIGAGYATETVRALHVRSITGSVFNQYVIQHNIGRAQVADDASGFQGDFCVLSLNQPIPATQLEQSALQLMFHYHDLDGGHTLSIDYTPAHGGQTLHQADVYYDAGASAVSITTHVGSTTRTVQRHVDWASGGAS